MSLITKSSNSSLQTSTPIVGHSVANKSQGIQIQSLTPCVSVDTKTVMALSESTLALERGDTAHFHPDILNDLVDELTKVLSLDPPPFEELQQIQWAIVDYLDIAKRMIESEGSKWEGQNAEIQKVLKKVSDIPISYTFPKKSLVAKAVALFFHPSDPKEKAFLHFKSFQDELRQIKISPKDDPQAKALLEKAIQRQLADDAYAEEGMPEGKKRLLNFIFSAAQLSDAAIKGSSKESLDEIYQREAARHEMATAPEQVEKEAAFIGVALHDKLAALRKMSPEEFVKFTKRFPETRPILESFRSSERPVTAEDISRASASHLASYKRPLEASLSEWWDAFTSPPKNREDPSVQAAQATSRIDALLIQMKKESSESIEPLKIQAKKLRSELIKSMNAVPTHEWAATFREQCFALETLEMSLKKAMKGALPAILPNEETLTQFGNKHLNLVKMAHLNKALDLNELEIPLPRGVSTGQVRTFLQKAAPKVFENWESLKLHKETYVGSAPFLEDPRTAALLAELDSEIEKAFAKEDAFTELQLSSEMGDWIEAQEKSGNYLMVRSTGSEDSHQMANAGGNASKAYVAPTPKSFCEAAGIVVRSYFSKNSLQNRLNANLNPFEEDLKLAVTAQELIGEPIGGTKNFSEIPVSFVLFTNEPLYIGGEEFRAMRLSGSYGHGEGVVSGQGIATDTVILLRSVSRPDQLYYLYNNQKKPTRLAPLRKENGEVALGKVENPAQIQNKAALSLEDLINIYRSGVLMEAFFDDHPTDIEGVVKNGKVYFVQARPVNRKPLLPTYLDYPVAEKLEAEILVPGKASVVSIAQRKEILFATTLEEAEHRLGTAGPQVKLVIVTQPEPENSHPVVNFSGLGMPCLYASDTAAIETLLAKIDLSHPLAVCMQRGTLNLWDSKAANLEDHIVEGFAVHPAKVALSLDVSSGLGALNPAAAPKELEGFLRQIRDNEDPLRALTNIESNPQLHYLRSKRKSLQDAYQDKPIPPAIQERLRILEQLDQKIDSALQEMRKVLEKPAGRLEQLFHVKVLETLLFGTRSNGLGRYSLLDVKSICDSIGILSHYQQKAPHAAHGLNLLLDGQQANPGAFPQWERFLLSLEPLVENGKITQEEWRQFEKLLTTLRETGALPFWLTFFQNQVKSTSFRPVESLQLERFKNLINQASPSDQKLMDSLGAEQRSLQQMQDQIDRFANPKSFPDAWKELKSRIATYSSTEWLEPLKTASPIVKSIGYRTMEAAVDLLDTAAKTVKSSHQFPNDAAKIKLFKEMLFPYYEMVRSWTEKLVPSGKIPTHSDWPIPQYFDQIHQLLSRMPDNDPAQFLPSRDFSVAAAILGTRTDFNRHQPDHLEDVLTLLHQNSLVSINALGQELLTPEMIQESLLPQPVKEAMKLIEHSNWGRASQRIGVQVKSKEIVLRYNVPLRNHSGHLDLHYDVESGKMVLKAHLLGQARDRWANIAYWGQALEAAGIWVQDRPLLITRQEISFSLTVTPQNLEDALRQYGLMAEYSLNGDFGTVLESLYDNYEKQPEIQQKLEQYFLSNLNRDVMPLYERYIHANRQDLQKIIDGSAKGIYHNDRKVRDIASRMWGMLFLLGKGFEVAEGVVKKGVSDTNPEIREAAYQLLGYLVEHSESYPIAMDAAATGIYDDDPSVRDISFRIWKLFFYARKGFDAAEQAIKKGLSDTNPMNRHTAYRLLENLVQYGQSYPIAIDAAAIGLYDNDQSVYITSFQIWQSLFKSHQGFDAAEQAIQKGLSDTNPVNRRTAYRLLKNLVQHDQSYPIAIDTATIGLYDNDEDIRAISFQIWIDLFKCGQGFDAAEQAIQKGLSDTNPVNRHTAYRLLENLVQYGQSYPIVIDAAAIGFYDNDQSVRATSFQIWQSLFKSHQGFDAAEQAIKKGLSDTNPEIREAAYQLLKNLVQYGQSYPIVIDAAAIGLYDNDENIRDISFQIWRNLLRRSQGFQAAEQAIKKGLSDTNPTIRQTAHRLLYSLVAYDQSYPIAIDAATIGLYDNDRHVRDISFQIWTTLFNSRQGFEAAEEAVKKGLSDTNPEIREAAYRLLDNLVQYGQSYPIAIDAAAIGAYDNDEDIRDTSVKIWERLFSRSQGLEVVQKVVKRGLSDTDPEIRYAAYQILNHLGDTNQRHEIVAEFAKELATSNNSTDRIRSINLLRKLVHQGKYYSIALDAAKSHKEYSVLRLWEALLQIDKKDPLKLEITKAGFEANHSDIKLKALSSFVELIKEGVGYNEALEAAKIGAQDPLPEIRNLAVELSAELLKWGQ